MINAIYDAYEALALEPPAHILAVVTVEEAKLDRVSIKEEKVALKAAIDKRLAYKRASFLRQLPPNFEEVEFSDEFDGAADFLGVADNANLRAFLLKTEGSTEILFSEEVGKVNMSGYFQQRAFIVTPQSIYNFKGQDFDRPQRKIDIWKLDGVVLSRKSSEVVLQVAIDHDYHLSFGATKMRQRDALMRVLTKQYQLACGYRLLPQIVVRARKRSSRVQSKAVCGDDPAQKYSPCFVLTCSYWHILYVCCDRRKWSIWPALCAPRQTLL